MASSQRDNRRLASNLRPEIMFGETRSGKSLVQDASGLARRLTRLLRHKPRGLHVDAKFRVAVTDVERKLRCSFEDLCTIVREDIKDSRPRFEITDGPDGQSTIRARWGHTFKVAGAGSTHSPTRVTLDPPSDSSDAPPDDRMPSYLEAFLDFDGCGWGDEYLTLQQGDLIEPSGRVEQGWHHGWKIGWTTHSALTRIGEGWYPPTYVRWHNAVSGSLDRHAIAGRAEHMSPEKRGDETYWSWAKDAGSKDSWTEGDACWQKEQRSKDWYKSDEAGSKDKWTEEGDACWSMKGWEKEAWYWSSTKDADAGSKDSRTEPGSFDVDSQKKLNSELEIGNKIAVQNVQNLATPAVASRWEETRSPGTPSTPARIGIDVGGVLNHYRHDRHNVRSSDHEWEKSRDTATPAAFQALAKIVKRFGREHTFILSKCSGEMQHKTEVWLFETMNICGGEIGFKKENVHFCLSRHGCNGKGSIATSLQLSHFVDDKDECLWSVYEEGNSKAAVERHSGKFFHMARGAAGRHLPLPKDWLAYKRPSCVTPVRDWPEVLQHLGIN